MALRFSPPRGTVRATFIAHGSGRVIQLGRLIVRAFGQVVGSVHVLSHTSNLYLPLRMISFLPVFPRLVSVSILSEWVLPCPAGYGFPVPFGCWPSLLKPSLPLSGYVPPLPLAY